MKKIPFLLSLFILLAAAWCFAQGELEPIAKDDRILICAPHPDDEVIGCGGLIQQALKAGAQVKVVYLTNGDHNQIAFTVYWRRPLFFKNEFLYMGETRRNEAVKAMKSLGVSKQDLIFLGYPDFGTFEIFSRYWNPQQPFNNSFTKVKYVPYKDSLTFGEPYIGQSILRDLKKVLMDYKPNKIFVSHPADVNVDHKSLYLFLQVALWDLDKQFAAPKVYPYLVHCVGWPLPRHYHSELGLEPPQKFTNSSIDWLKFSLTPEQLNKKYKAVLCSRSQTASSAFYLFAFCRKNELFGDYPLVDLAQQVTLKNNAMSFVGFSKMFPQASDSGVSAGPDNPVKDEGSVSYAVAADNILINIEKPEGMSRRIGIEVYLFGYSAKTPFALMPKIRINTLHEKFRVFNGFKMLAPDGVSLELKEKNMILKVPRKMLGDPDFILTSMKMYGGKLPLDAIGYRKIKIK